MSVYKHCSGCGRAFEQKAWQRESFCGSCGEPLKNRVLYEEPLDIHPYPERNSPQGLRLELSGLIEQLGRCAKTHPIPFGIGATGIGVGMIAAAPVLMTIATGLAWIGALITSCSFLLAGYEDRRGDAEKGISLGLLILVAALIFVLTSYLCFALGVAAVLAGTGLVVKETATQMLRRRIEKQIREKSITELIDLSHRLN